MIATVEDGRLISLRPDDEHPLSQGYACPKGLAFPEVQHDPDRVLHPLRRVAGGALGEFEQVSWDEALDDIAVRLRALLDTHGGGTVGQFFGNPVGFNITGTLWAGALMTALGTGHQYSVGSQDINSRYVASKLLYGSISQVPFPDLRGTDLLLVLGANPLVSRASGVRAPRVKEHLSAIVAGGGRVVVVDPRRSETAKAFEHVSIEPDGDAFLLASLIQVVAEEGLVDQEAIDRQSVGAETLLAAVAPFTPEATVARTGIDPDVVRSLARDLAAAPRAAVYGRTGTCLGEHATLVSVLIDALALLTGNLDREGGVLLGQAVVPFEETAEKAGRLGYDTRRSRIGGFPDVMDTWPAAIMADEITTPGEGQLRALFVLAGNPVLSSVDGPGLAAALEQLDLMVALDLYVNETNRHADYVLPATTWLEREDVPFAIVASSPWPHVQHTPAVLEPAGEARAEWEVFDEIARRAGISLFLPSWAAAVTRPLRTLARRAGVRVTPWTLVDLLLRTGPHGDRFGLRRGGLSLKPAAVGPRGRGGSGVPAADDRAAGDAVAELLDAQQPDADEGPQPAARRPHPSRGRRRGGSGRRRHGAADLGGGGDRDGRPAHRRGTPGHDRLPARLGPRGGLDGGQRRRGSQHQRAGLGPRRGRGVPGRDGSPQRHPRASGVGCRGGRLASSG
jgi:formate dehydrogenase